ncbi:MAG: sigma-70 family RNA polymerase sigma factor [Acutalibacteraceae bacterium]|jgi:RNA polymerase sporulation-specific sigma factor
MAIDESLSTLLEAVRQGSQDGFAALAFRYEPMLRRLAERFRGASIDAEDLMQEGLLGLLSAARHYQSDEVPFSSYAFICVRRRMLSAIARNARRPDRLLADDEWEREMEALGAASPGEDDPALQLARRETEEQLYSRLRSLLSEREYEVLVMYLDAYSYEETAARLGIPVKAVDNALQRARRKLIAKGWSPLA